MTKIGQLPKNWKIVRLGDISEPTAPIRYGVVQIGPAVSDGIPIIPIKFIRQVSTAKLHRSSPEIEGQYAGSRVHGGDILLSVKGTIGEVGIVPDGFRGNIAREIARIRPKRQYDRDFVALQLEAEATKRRIDKKVVGSTRLEFSIHAVRDFEIAVPPLPEQQQIAEILRTWDEAIDAASRLIAAKRRRLDSLTVGLVFGTLRLPEFETGGDRTQGRWFDVPPSWSITRVGKVARESSRRNADGNVSEVLSCSKYDGFVRSLEYFKKQVYSADLTTYKIIARGEFGFPSNHIEEGSIGLQDLEDLAVVSPIYTIFCFDDARVDNRFAIRVLKTSLYRHIFEVSTSSSVDRRGSLRWSEFSRLPFPLPPLEEQQAVAAILNRQAYEIDTESARLDALQRQKRGLMQKLLTGEWRVNPPPSSP